VNAKANYSQLTAVSLSEHGTLIHSIPVLTIIFMPFLKKRQ